MSAETPLIDIRPDHWEIVQRILQEHVPNLEVWAFGSRAQWSAKEFSDLDLAIITDEPLPLDTSAALSEAFSDSDLPWKVDVVDWASVGDELKKVITRDKVVLKNGDGLVKGKGWKECFLGDVVELKRGYDLPQKKRLRGNVHLISSTVITDFHSIPMVKGPGVVTGRYGTLGQVFFVDEDFWPLNTTLYVRDFKGNDPRFVAYFLRSIDFLSYSDKAAVPGLNRNHLHRAPIKIPTNLEEQRAIARILGTLDDKIELNRKQNETLEAMARAMFKAWFVDFEPVRAKMEGRWKRGQSLPGMPAHLYDLFPDRMVESELGEIPEGGGVGALGDVAAHLNRVVRPSEIERDEPYIGLEHMPKRCISLFEWGKANGLESNKLEFKRGEILFGKLRPYFHKVGVAPIDGVCSTDILTIIPRFPIWFGFVLAHFSSDRFVEHVSSGSTGTKMPRTSWAEMARYSVVLPSEGVAASFDGFVRVTGEEIINSVRESMSLSRVRDTLLPRLMSGDLLVRNPEQFLESVRLK